MTRNQEKRQAFESMLAVVDVVCVQVAPRCAGVILPDAAKVGMETLLMYGMNLPVPITDMEIDDAGIQASLSFQRQLHGTFVPWESVSIISDSLGDRAHIWRGDRSQLVAQDWTDQPPKPALKLVD